MEEEFKITIVDKQLLLNFINSDADTISLDIDFNLLMQIIQIIRNNFFVTNVNYNIEGDFIIEGLTSTKVLNIIINREDFKSDLEMCYFGVVEFIKWYNQNKEKEN